MIKATVICLLLCLLQTGKSSVYLTILSANSKNPTSCLIQISKNGEMIVDDYKSNGNCKIELSKGLYVFQFIKCDTSSITLNVVNEVHRVGVFIDDCPN